MKIIRSYLRISLLIGHIIIGVIIVLIARSLPGIRWYETQQGKNIIQWWFKLTCKILAVRIKIHGKTNFSPGTLFVANHVSWLDIITLLSTLQSRFISKDNLIHWPVFGWLAQSTGTLFIQRHKKFVLHELINTIKINLNNKQSVTFFPEGTTTDGRQAGHFYSSLFKSVSFAEYLVQPIAIQYMRYGQYDPIAPFIGQDNFMSHLLRITKQSETNLLLSFTPAFSTTQRTRQEIADLAKQHIRHALQQGTTKQMNTL